MSSIASRYQIVLRDASGNVVAIFDTFESLSFERKVNDYGSYAITFVDNDDARFDYFSVDCQVEIWRSVPALGLDWYLEFTGFHRRALRTLGDDGLRYFRSDGVDCNHLLARRHIAYKSGTIRSTKNDYAEDVMKEYVYENCGAGASDATRARDGVMAGFTVEAESGSHADTPIWTGDRSFQSLIDVLQEVANYTVGKASDPTPVVVDFAVVPTGAATFEFRTYHNQLGTDRRIGSASPVIFAAELNNLSEISYDDNRTSEVNAAIVLGKGDGATQQVVARENTSGGGESAWNDIETVVSATSNDFVYQLNDAGDAALEQKKSTAQFGAKPLQIESTLYGLHYFLGDQVTVRFGAVVIDRKIMSVAISIGDDGAEDISIDWGDVVK